MLKLAALVVCSLAAVFGHQGPQNDDYHFYCSGKTVGNYENPANSCSDTFYSCVADGYPAMGIERHCPEGLFFNEDLNRCLEEKFVPACLVEEEEETEFERFIRINNNIVKTCADGKYEHPDKPCSSEYVVCDDGHITIKNCPFPEFLRFDADTERCLEEQYVRACQEDSEEPERSLNAEDVTCTRSGTYFVENPLQACSTEYFTCVDKVAYELSCPENLYFDKLSGNCLNAQLCPACRGHVHVAGYHAPTYGHSHLPLATKYYPKTHSPIVPVAAKVLPGVSIKYVDHSPVVATYDLDNQFYQHTHPELQHEQAPFDVETPTPLFQRPHTHSSQDHEDPKQQVVDYSHKFNRVQYGHDHFVGHPVAPANKAHYPASPLAHGHAVPLATAHYPAASAPSYAHAHYPSYNYHTHQKDEKFVCWTKPDGNYAAAECVSQYYTCDHGKLGHDHCTYGLVFSESEGECVRLSVCLKQCPYCAEREDGIYTIDCNTYVECRDHQSTVSTCPIGQAFNDERHCCVPVSECPAPCGTYVVSLSYHPKAVQYPSYPTYPAVYRADPYCANRGDGVYKIDCTTYVECLDHQSTVSTCPIGQAFYDDRHCCVPVSECPAPCGTYVVSVSYHHKALQYPTYPAVYRADPYCANRDDGLYKIDCTTYVECRDHQSEVNTCPIGQAFYDDRHCCVPVSECPAPCGTYVVSVSYHPKAVQYPSYPTYPAVYRADPYCANRGDGVYKIDCTTYVECRDHQSEVSTCPIGQAFYDDRHCCVPLAECPAPCGLYVVKVSPFSGLYPKGPGHIIY